MLGGNLRTRISERVGQSVGQRVDPDVVRAARGALLEATGTALRNEQLADRGRLEQFHAMRSMQVRKSRDSWAQLSWQQRAGVVIKTIKR